MKKVPCVYDSGRVPTLKLQAEDVLGLCGTNIPGSLWCGISAINYSLPGVWKLLKTVWGLSRLSPDGNTLKNHKSTSASLLFSFFFFLTQPTALSVKLGVFTWCPLQFKEEKWWSVKTTPEHFFKDSFFFFLFFLFCF